MTPTELKQKVQATGSHFFDRESMRFFGDTMSNFGCVSTELNGIPCWRLHRKRPTKDSSRGMFYFRKDNFEEIYPDVN
jgi:hypothetical protein